MDIKTNICKIVIGRLNTFRYRKDFVKLKGYKIRSKSLKSLIYKIVMSCVSLQCSYVFHDLQYQRLQGLYT